MEIVIMWPQGAATAGTTRTGCKYHSFSSAITFMVTEWLVVTPIGCNPRSTCMYSLHKAYSYTLPMVHAQPYSDVRSSLLKGIKF